MLSFFLLLGCNLSYIVDLFAGLHELASASARTLLKLTSSMCALLKPFYVIGFNIRYCQLSMRNINCSECVRSQWFSLTHSLCRARPEAKETSEKKWPRAIPSLLALGLSERATTRSLQFKNMLRLKTGRVMAVINIKLWTGLSKKIYAYLGSFSLFRSWSIILNVCLISSDYHSPR